jgi:hypothetical protein
MNNFVQTCSLYLELSLCDEYFTKYVTPCRPVVHRRFLRNILPPSSGSTTKPSNSASRFIIVGCFLGLLFDLKMEVKCFYESSVSLYWTKRHSVLEYTGILHLYR